MKMYFTTTSSQIPQVLLRLKKYTQCEKGQVRKQKGHWKFLKTLKKPSLQFITVVFLQDFTDDVNIAFEYLLKLTPLLDKADQRCK